MRAYIATHDLGFTNLSGDLPNGLLITEQHARVEFLICTCDEKFAVCLEPTSGFAAFELDAVNDAWRGCFVTDVVLEADISSGSTRALRDLRPGDLVVQKGGIFVAARPTQIGHQPKLIRWGDAVALGAGTLNGGFSRWRIVRKEGELLQVLREIDSEA